MKQTRIDEILDGARPTTLAEAVTTARYGLRRARLHRDAGRRKAMDAVLHRVTQLVANARRVTHSASMVEQLDGIERDVARIDMSAED